MISPIMSDNDGELMGVTPHKSAECVGAKHFKEDVPKLNLDELLLG